MGRQKLDKAKDTRYVFRPSTTTIELIDWYLDSRGGSRTKALEDLIQIGGTVLIQRDYKDED